MFESYRDSILDKMNYIVYDQIDELNLIGEPCLNTIRYKSQQLRLSFLRLKYEIFAAIFKWPSLHD